MYTKTVLSVEELIDLLDAVWEYNDLGQVGNIVFHCQPNAEGTPTVTEIEVWSGAPRLKVRTAPEQDAPTVTPEEIAAQSVGKYLSPTGG